MMSMGLSSIFVLGVLSCGDAAPAPAAEVSQSQQTYPQYSPGVVHRPTAWSYEGVYFALGASPASTLHIDGFNPGVRYDSEIGLHWRRGKTDVMFGGEFKIHQVLGRKKPGYGYDGVFTLSHGRVFGRVGAGVVTGIPGSRDPNDVRPAMGGLVGFGVQGGGDHVLGRMGLEYDVRMDTDLRVNQTILLTLRLVFGF